jgi:multiple sugar transport system substrate-binding protein
MLPPGRSMATRLAAALLACLLAARCSAGPGSDTLTFSGSGLGREAEIVRAQLARFAERHPGVRVELRVAPDAADQRHQLYVQWLNAHASEPDVLQLDVIWTPEFAAAGWVLPLDRFAPRVEEFFPASIEANRWRESLYALPWFVDVGMLYWRTDLMAAPPASFADVRALTEPGARPAEVEYGFVWQGARYEGLVTVFLEHLGAFGGRILDGSGRVAVDSEAAVGALTWMRDAIHVRRSVPGAVLTWQEEQTRFAFQNGRAMLMRNWPYARALLADPSASRVAGRFGIAPMPAGPGGPSTSALGGSQLAINARTRQPDLAYALVEFLTAAPQMLERAEIAGQYPPRPALYDDPALDRALGARAADVRRIVERAVPRPVTPVYTELSAILQVHLHRALTRQAEPRAALRAAAEAIRGLLDRAGLSAGRDQAKGPATRALARATESAATR